MDTIFRTLMNQFNEGWGNRPEWPLLLCKLLEEEFLRQRTAPHAYSGAEVAIFRDGHAWQNATVPEKRAVYSLYHLCRENSMRQFTIGERHFWLLGYEWPNQDNHRGRRADLVGLSETGGLVVFECKVGTGGYSPIAAVLEGLDYLTCLSSESNFARIREQVIGWQGHHELEMNEHFQNVQMDINQVHEVIVLADELYFNDYVNRGESQRGGGLKQFAMSCHEQQNGRLKIDFAVTDFQAPVAKWLVGS